jgi:hypothetical protein
MNDNLRISIETASDHPREVRTVAELTRLLGEYELAGLQWTDRVIVEFRAKSHSHPVLTLNTLFTGTHLLATYVHEQVHWWVADHPGTDPAIKDSETLWPELPDHNEVGSRSGFSTRLHLIVCHLEHRAMEQLVGDLNAASLLEEQINGLPSYPWIRVQVRDHAAALDRVCSAHDLWPDRLMPRQ